MCTICAFNYLIMEGSRLGNGYMAMIDLTFPFRLAGPQPNERGLLVAHRMMPKQTEEQNETKEHTFGSTPYTRTKRTTQIYDQPNRTQENANRNHRQLPLSS